MSFVHWRNGSESQTNDHLTNLNVTPSLMNHRHISRQTASTNTDSLPNYQSLKPFRPQDGLLASGNTLDYNAALEGIENELMEGWPTKLYKTRLCRHFSVFGKCNYGNECQFAHGMEELKTLTGHPKYKTELCLKFVKTGRCKYAHRCFFIHPPQTNQSTQTKTSDLDESSARSSLERQLIDELIYSNEASSLVGTLGILNQTSSANALNILSKLKTLVLSSNHHIPPPTDNMEANHNGASSEAVACTSAQWNSFCKTKLCRHFLDNGACDYGDKCQFAHGIDQLGHPKFKTKLCKTFQVTGYCRYGNNCLFIHENDNSANVSNDLQVDTNMTFDFTALSPELQFYLREMHSNSNSNNTCEWSPSSSSGSFASLSGSYVDNFSNSRFESTREALSERNYDLPRTSNYFNSF